MRELSVIAMTLPLHRPPDDRWKFHKEATQDGAQGLKPNVQGSPVGTRQRKISQGKLALTLPQ